VTAEIRFAGTSSGGGYLQVRTDTTASGPFKNYVYGNFSAQGGTPTGEFLSDLSGTTITC
jgi:hypothetical protein